MAHLLILIPAKKSCWGNLIGTPVRALPDQPAISMDFKSPQIHSCIAGATSKSAAGDSHVAQLAATREVGPQGIVHVRVNTMTFEQDSASLAACWNFQRHVHFLQIQQIVCETVLRNVRVPFSPSGAARQDIPTQFRVACAIEVDFFRTILPSLLCTSCF